MGRRQPKPNAVAAELDKLKGKQVDGKVNLLDVSSIKRALDDFAVKVLEEEGHVEDVKLTDARIAIGLFTCGLAAVAQFYPKKAPENHWVLVFCVTFYILATMLQTLVLGRIGGDLFFQSKLKEGSVLCVTSKMARYSDEYELGVGKREGIWASKQRPLATTVARVTDHFDTEGQLLEDKFRPVVTSLLRDFEGRQPSKATVMKKR